MVRIDVRLAIARMAAATKLAPIAIFSRVFRNVASSKWSWAKLAGTSQKRYGTATTAGDRKRGATTGKRIAKWMTDAGRSVRPTMPSRERNDEIPWSPRSSGRMRSTCESIAAPTHQESANRGGATGCRLPSAIVRPNRRKAAPRKIGGQFLLTARQPGNATGTA